MEGLPEKLQEMRARPIPERPRFFDIKTDSAELSALIDSGALLRVSDDYEEASRELFAIQNPTLVYAPGFEDAFQKHYTILTSNVPEILGRWVYFPWNGTLCHILAEADYFRVRTARNRNLITEVEQERFYNSTIGIAGLSVGSSVAFSIALQGGGKKLKLADMDYLALSNTNRVLSGAPELGSLKVSMAARRIYEMNPYAEIELFPQGLQPENIAAFFDGLDIVIDELDNLAVKFLIREHAKKNHIAVVMGADNGDNAVIDIERYDVDPQPPFFHGRMGNVSYDSLKALDKFGIGKTITQHIGPENVTMRMQESLMEMGKTIVSWPQLGGAALINGAAVAYCVRKILNGEKLESNRALVSVDEKLVPDFMSDEQKKERTETAHAFAARFGITL